MKKFFKNILLPICNTIEIYIPFIMFSTLFIVFILGIVFRYFFEPLTWTLELSLICFIWVALLGGLYAKRKHAHVEFTLVYDAASTKVKLWMAIIGNFLLTFSFTLAIIPSYKYVMFMSYKKSNVLHIPMHIAYFPFVIFLVFMTGHYTYDLVRDIRKLIKGEYQP